VQTLSATWNPEFPLNRELRVQLDRKNLHIPKKLCRWSDRSLDSLQILEHLQRIKRNGEENCTHVYPTINISLGNQRSWLISTNHKSLRELEGYKAIRTSTSTKRIEMKEFVVGNEPNYLNLNTILKVVRSLKNFIINGLRTSSIVRAARFARLDSRGQHLSTLVGIISRNPRPSALTGFDRLIVLGSLHSPSFTHDGDMTLQQLMDFQTFRPITQFAALLWSSNVSCWRHRHCISSDTSQITSSESLLLRSGLELPKYTALQSVNICFDVISFRS
jgi:hypothetical protein